MNRILWQPEDWPRIAEFVANRVGSERETDKFTAIGLGTDDKVVAGVVYSGFNGSQVLVAVAIDGKFITREFLWFIHFYAFKQLGVKRITACVEQTNTVSQQFVTRLGFKLESVMERAGRTGDLLVYRLFPEECRYLEKPHARTAQKSSATQ